MTERMFEGFAEEYVDVGDTTLFVRHCAGDRPVVLLHGHPRTSSTWHRVAPILKERGFAVVCPDLRGYGRSGKPTTSDTHEEYSKRAMAGDVVALMNTLGHEVFDLAGHDRGSYVALRLSLDHPERVSALAVLDSVPISEALARCDATFAEAWWHWFFFAQPDKPERAINADPVAWYRPDRAAMGEANYAEWLAAVTNPQTVTAMLEDYRAGLGIDREHEEADRAAERTIAAPVLVLWSERDDLERLYGDPLSVWARWCADLRGHSIDSGHHMAEDAPVELAAGLASFFSARN